MSVEHPVIIRRQCDNVDVRQCLCPLFCLPEQVFFSVCQWVPLREKVSLFTAVSHTVALHLRCAPVVFASDHLSVSDELVDALQGSPRLQHLLSTVGSLSAEGQVYVDPYVSHHSYPQRSCALWLLDPLGNIPSRRAGLLLFPYLTQLKLWMLADTQLISLFALFRHFPQSFERLGALSLGGSGACVNVELFALGSLPSLRKLCLCSVELSTTSVPAIFSCRQLTHLDIRACCTDDNDRYGFVKQLVEQLRRNPLAAFAPPRHLSSEEAATLCLAAGAAATDHQHNQHDVQRQSELFARHNQSLASTTGTAIRFHAHERRIPADNYRVLKAHYGQAHFHRQLEQLEWELVHSETTAEPNALSAVSRGGILQRLRFWR